MRDGRAGLGHPPWQGGGGGGVARLRRVCKGQGGVEGGWTASANFQGHIATTSYRAQSISNPINRPKPINKF